MYYAFSDQEFNYDRVVIEADVRVLNSVGDGDFGFVCGYRENGDLYMLEISEDGYYTIWKEINDEVVFLVDWTYSQDVVTSGPMRLSAQCGRDRLVLALNGKVLASVSDAEFQPGGGVGGMVAGTFEVPGIKVSFDNLKLNYHEVKNENANNDRPSSGEGRRSQSSPHALCGQRRRMAGGGWLYRGFEPFAGRICAVSQDPRYGLLATGESG